MEDTLLPWVHYVPVEQDFADLESRVTWCLEHPAECEAIGLGGRCFMQRFLDDGAEEAVETAVLARVAAVVREAGEKAPCAHALNECE